MVVSPIVVVGKSRGSLVDAAQRAQATIYGAVQLQANILSYVDSFYLLGFACLVAIPLVFLMRPNKPGQDGEADSGESGGAQVVSLESFRKKT